MKALKIITLFFATCNYFILGHSEVMLTKYTTTSLFPFLSDLWGDKADEEMQRSVFENMALRVFHSIMK